VELVMRAYAVGECMLELTGRLGNGARLAYGGDTLNTALYLSRLGLRTEYVTAVGTDPWSDDLVNAWADEGVGTGCVLRHPSRTVGLYAVRTDDAGERTFTYWRSESAARALFQLAEVGRVEEALANADLLYLSGISLSLFDASERARLVAVAQSVRRRGGRVAFDPNYRPRGWSSPEAARTAIDALAPFVSTALPTFEDEAALRGDADPRATARRWRDAGADEVVVKLGPEGALVAWADGERRLAPPSVVAPVDTTGAGDSFNAGYLFCRWKGCAPPDAAAFGARLAGEVIRHPGAIVPRAATPHRCLEDVA
jgi:2-dehydro-3-deoxygluconokinase